MNLASINNEITIREVLPTDVDFIYTTWLKSYKAYSYFAKRIRNFVFYFWHHQVVEKILNKTNTRVLIACPKSETDVILGYLIYEVQDPVKYKTDSEDQKSNIIHYAFVKQEFRKLGIFNQIVKHADINLDKSYFSHWTFDWTPLTEKYQNLIYDPYRI